MARGDQVDEWTDVLAAVPLFAGLSRRHVKTVAKLGKLQRLPQYSMIVRAGEPGDAFYLLLDGHAVVRPPGKRALRLDVGSYFGELALLDDAPRSASVEAADEVLLMRIGRRDFERLLETEPKVSLVLLRQLAGRLRASERSAQH
jgi:CRP-like cAMP-binding protein